MLQHTATTLVIFLSYIALSLGDGQFNDSDAVKTILTKDGDLFKCINIHQQPTLSHPLLKSHKVQMKPSSYPYELHNRSLSLSTKSLAQLPTISCPRGTVPILQDTKGDIKISEGFHTMDGPSGELAMMKTVDDIYGSRVSINVYEPKVKEQTKDFSASWVLMLNKEDALESIGAGSMRDNTHDALCYDHGCPGFVQVNSKVGLGSRIQPVSVYNGPQHFIDVLLFKDQTTKDWWVAVGGTPIGYWPNSIFSHLKDKVTEAGWGGAVHGPTVKTNYPEMGSGHFASEGFGKAAYVSNIKIVADNSKYYTPDTDKTFARSTSPHCYSVGNYGHDEGGMHIYYGGPEGCTDY